MSTAAVIPTRSRVVRAIVKVLPRSVVEMLKNRLSPELAATIFRWLSVMQPVARLVNACVSGWIRLRYPAAVKSLDFVVVGSVVAVVDASASPLTIRRQAAAFVADALAGAGVEHFFVRGNSETASVVAVPARSRRAALAALANAAAHRPVYVGKRFGASNKAWSGLAKANVVKIVQYAANRANGQMMGAEFGCEVEFWQENGDCLVAPRPNRAVELVAARGRTVNAEEALFTGLVARGDADGRTYPTRAEFLGDLIDDVLFPVDIVYTWVDGADAAWRARRDAAMGEISEQLNVESANESRFISRDELKFSMRSIAQFAPWVNRIWLVTDDQVPSWLDTSHEKIRVVSHRELFQSRGTLPTFNSHAIESQLHHIEGLAEHFLYFNDDVFLGRAVSAKAFFEPNGLSKVVLSTAKVDPRPISLDDIPATAAGKNNRNLIKEFGRQVTYKMKHCPHPLRRSVLKELEERFPAEFESTAQHQFRHPADISPTSSLYQYYTLATQRAVMGNLSYMYANVSHPATPRRLQALLATRDSDVFCINDTDTDESMLQQIDAMVRRFSSDYFLSAAPWEKS